MIRKDRYDKYIYFYDRWNREDRHIINAIYGIDWIGGIDRIYGIDMINMIDKTDSVDMIDGTDRKDIR